MLFIVVEFEQNTAWEIINTHKKRSDLGDRSRGNTIVQHRVNFASIKLVGD